MVWFGKYFTFCFVRYESNRIAENVRTPVRAVRAVPKTLLLAVLPPCLEERAVDPPRAVLPPDDRDRALPMKLLPLAEDPAERALPR